jgi:hypothetical protein
MSENGVVIKKQIRKFKRHPQAFPSWLLKLIMIHEILLINDAIENIFSMSSQSYDMQQTWESGVA